MFLSNNLKGGKQGQSGSKGGEEGRGVDRGGGGGVDVGKPGRYDIGAANDTEIAGLAQHGDQ